MPEKSSLLSTAVAAVVAPERVKRVHVSLPTRLYARARERMRELGLESFSEYVRHLIAKDLDRGGGK